MKIFLINLPKSTERRKYVETRCQEQGLDLIVTEAVNGHAEYENLLKNYNLPKRLWLSSGKMPSKGETGCYGSHYNLWKKCVELNEPIIAMEDDATILPDAKKKIQQVSKLIEKYGYLRLEPKDNNENQVFITPNVSKLFKNYDGTRCYAIAPWAAKTLLESSKKWDIPVDNYIGSFYRHGVESYAFTPPVVHNSEAFGSDIQGGNEKKCPFYRKPSRNLYRAFVKLNRHLHNRRFLLNLLK